MKSLRQKFGQPYPDKMESYVWKKCLSINAQERWWNLMENVYKKSVEKPS